MKLKSKSNPEVLVYGPDVPKLNIDSKSFPGALVVTYGYERVVSQKVNNGAHIIWTVDPDLNFVDILLNDRFLGSSEAVASILHHNKTEENYLSSQFIGFMATNMERINQLKVSTNLGYLMLFEETDSEPRHAIYHGPLLSQSGSSVYDQVEHIGGLITVTATPGLSEELHSYENRLFRSVDGLGAYTPSDSTSSFLADSM